MAMRASSGSIWRAVARQARRSRSAAEAQHTTWRSASTSRVTLGISGTSSRCRPSPSPRASARSKDDDIPPPTSGPKPRKLFPPVAGRGVSNAFIDEARRDMQLRRMPYNESDLKWLRGARHEVYTLNGKQTELHKEQKQLRAELAKYYQAFRNGKGKDKAPSSENEASDPAATPTEGEASTDTATAAEEQKQHLTEVKERLKKTKEELETIHKQQEEIRQRSARVRLSWPNYCHPDVPLGPEENAVLLSVQDPLDILPKEFDVMKESWNKSVMQAKHFPEGPKPDPKREHLPLAASANGAEVDTVSGLLATGSSWPYLLGSISLLEHALSQYAMSTVVRRGFLAVSPPDVVRADLADRCGFRPRNEKAKQTYFLEPAKSSKGSASEPADASADLCLAATAEIPLAGLLAARTFDLAKKGSKHTSSAGHESSLVQKQELPIKLAALGHAFRAEAGARGADTRGLYRVHQFSKIEMFVATEGDLDASNAMLEELRTIQEEIIGGLGLPYRVLDMPTEELGASAYRKYDIEVWMPGRGSWGEVSSASNCTSYQARRLSINVKNAAPTPKEESDPLHPTVHTLNATAAAIPRLIVAILENHGVENDKLVLPDTLKPFWLAGEKDPNVTWLYTGKAAAGSQSRLKRALMRVRSIAKRNGTDAPTMVASFLILHELTAIVPLAILFYAFGALGVGTAVLQWLLGDGDAAGKISESESQPLLSRFRAWARLKEERFERYCRKKGYLGFDKQDADAIDAAKDLGDSRRFAESFANMVAAYILVKALLPVRIGASVALAGPFSRSVLEPLKNLVRRRAPGKSAVMPA